MQVSLSWLKSLIDLKLSPEEAVEVVSLHTYPTKELTRKYFVLDIKGYNRPDLLSVRGVARELSALTGSPLKFTDPESFVWDNQDLPQLIVEVEDKALCPVYCLAKIEGLKVKDSELGWVKKLEESGMRPVNNIADVTNLVMLEYGQPLHAFDASAVENETILVRTARQGSQIVTLDNKTRTLTSTDLLITDHSKSLGIAGVMGGKNSEVTGQTTTILLEAAIFDPITIRRTATRLGLQSEASKRFQHGLTKKGLLQALDAAIRMYQELGGKLTGFSIVGETGDEVKTIDLSQSQLDSLIGIKIPQDDVERYLTKLGFSKGEYWTAPYWRLDIEYPEDLIEEVARMYGYHKLPANPLPGKPPKPIDQSIFKLINSSKSQLAKFGLTEVFSYSFYSTKVLTALALTNNLDSLIKVANPMSAETTYLRNTLWPNLLEVIERNLKVGYKDIAIFELGKAYQLTEDEGVKEVYQLALSLMNGTDNPIEELHTITKKFLEEMDLDIQIIPGKAPGDTKHLFHPHRFTQLESKGKVIGNLAEVHPKVLDQLGVNQRVAIMELELGRLP